ncbi:hypothetical protein SNOG_13078 [Parastagonospora nodorum SN15]|uniref:J domain-containing protein n=1 Tax=Phaeosphaeria nodorum (strain SN15 / ATCC MYA-4574 / FGSC 10173) TaxID=321614 RepID=Q0U586_PHANO|nr:hypothetical protein SNOG_13078 [Parastagonospora nodorum SN15]EAT79405.2 hypothetical protein SNOG_13078 [Parastagonospora nodorum SN15]
MPPVRSAQPAIPQPAVTRPLLTSTIVVLASVALPIDDQMPDTYPVVAPPISQHRLPKELPHVSPAFLDVPQPTRLRPSRKRPIEIFVDSTADSVPRGPPSQRPRLDGRSPLGKRSDSANSTPCPSPRDDAAPYSQSPNDSFWTGQENRDPNPPVTPEPFVAAFPRARIVRPVRSPRLPLPPPKDVVLYDILGLNDWNVSKNQILSAWRHVSLDLHPDRVAEEFRGTATILMQEVNAAKEVLTDRAARRAYHRTGALPMAM